MDVNPLLVPLRDALTTLGQKSSEHELIKMLVAQKVIQKDFNSTSLSLFHTHFLVFNALYQLNDELGFHSLALDITPLAIQVVALPCNDEELPASYTATASLRDYYLDWSNCELADDASVNALLDSFWQRFGEGPILESDKQNALKVLGLDETEVPMTYHTIKQAYRRQVMIEHPDRGGDKARLQEINDAMAVLAHAVGKR